MSAYARSFGLLNNFPSYFPTIVSKFGLSVFQSINLETLLSPCCVIIKLPSGSNVIPFDPRSPSGSVGTIEASTAIRPKDKEASIFISGTKGFLKVGGVALNKIEDYEFPGIDNSLKDRLLHSSVDVSSGYGESHKDVIYNFIDAIKSDQLPFITASSTINTVRAIHAIYKSCEIGSWVNVEKNSISSLLGN